MKIQADITTYLIDNFSPYYIHGKEVGIKEILAFAGIDTLRVSVFSQTSPLLTIDKSLSVFDALDGSQTNLYLCVHCSDTWADPSHQTIPEAWSFASVKELKTCFIDYLVSIFETIKSKNITVKYLQVGNEISNGLLWSYLRSSLEYVDFIITAHYLCRYYFPDAKIVLHTDLSYSSAKACLWYDLMKNRKVDYDLVGLSYYPVWHGPLKELEKTVSEVYALTGKQVFLCEIGYMNTNEKTSAWFGHWKCGDIPYSPGGQKQYLEHFRTFLQNRLSQSVYPEMFYWGMFSNGSPEHFPIALFDRNGHAFPAFYELKIEN